jgi:hypothetical protein
MAVVVSIGPSRKARSDQREAFGGQQVAASFNNC